MNDPKQTANDPQTPTENGSPESDPSTEHQGGQQTASASDGGAQSAPRSAGAESTGFRYSEDYEVDFLRGKTPEEAARIAKDLRDAVVSGAPAPNAAGNQPPPQTPPQSQPNVNPNAPQYPPQTPSQNGGQPPQTPQPPDPQLAYSDPAAYQQQMIAYQQWMTQSTVQQASAPFLQSQAQMARNASRNDPDYSDVWQAYGTEIDIEMKRVPLQQKANPAAWNMAAELVAGRNRHELASKQAERLAAGGPQNATVSAEGDARNGSPASAARDEIGKLFAQEHPAIAKFIEIGKSAEDIRQHARHMGHSPDDYAEMLTKQHTMTSTPRAHA